MLALSVGKAVLRPTTPPIGGDFPCCSETQMLGYLQNGMSDTLGSGRGGYKGGQRYWHRLVAVGTASGRLRDRDLFLTSRPKWPRGLETAGPGFLQLISLCLASDLILREVTGW